MPRQLNVWGMPLEEISKASYDEYEIVTIYTTNAPLSYYEDLFSRLKAYVLQIQININDDPIGECIDILTAMDKAPSIKSLRLFSIFNKPLTPALVELLVEIIPRLEIFVLEREPLPFVVEKPPLLKPTVLPYCHGLRELHLQYHYQCGSANRSIAELIEQTITLKALSLVFKTPLNWDDSRKFFEAYSKNKSIVRCYLEYPSIDISRPLFVKALVDHPATMFFWIGRFNGDIVPQLAFRDILLKNNTLEVLHHETESDFYYGSHPDATTFVDKKLVSNRRNRIREAMVALNHASRRLGIPNEIQKEILEYTGGRKSLNRFFE